MQLSALEELCINRGMGECTCVGVAQCDSFDLNTELFPIFEDLEGLENHEQKHRSPTYTGRY